MPRWRSMHLLLTDGVGADAQSDRLPNTEPDATNTVSDSIPDAPVH
jgi:hypothetical protein